LLEVGADSPAPLEMKLNMKIRNLLIILGVAATASFNVMAGPLLSPKAADQPKTVSGYNSDPNLAATGLKSAPPQIVASQTKTVPGKSTQVNPSLTCTRHMAGSPKMIGACTEHASDNMSCCSVAPVK
jgi:hypothetical protein